MNEIRFCKAGGHRKRAVNALRRHSQATDDASLQYRSPLGREHVNPTGDYLWRGSAKIGAGKFRPLRDMQLAERALRSVF
jgi:hypothetical protein